jgi:glyoxylase-like metal-dependent hydrolase (beta-lactamase superfamily II)
LTEITPLLLGTLGSVPASVVRHLAGGPDEERAVPLFAYLVESENGVLLFDLGSYPPEQAAALGRGVTDHRTPAQALRELGRDPADVDTVVVSHLHWDHCVGADGLPGARILVQREEVRFAFAPDPEQWHPYDSWELGRNAAWLDVRDRLEPVDGYLRLAPDLLVVPTPGHTPGSQSLLVRTERDFLLCGDLFMRYENWLGQAWGDARTGRVPPGIHSDLRAWRTSMDLVDRHDWVPLPAHDARAPSVLTGQWAPPRPSSAVRGDPPG